MLQLSSTLEGSLQYANLAQEKQTNGMSRQLLGIEVMETHSSQPGNSQAQPGTNRYSAEWVRKHEEQTGQVRGGAW